jgi:novobiocin biosynthesis protein NovU/D-mycarose 3-C-methyltransferase
VVKEGTKPEPDVYVLLSWNFADEILPKFDDFRRRGGRILVPIPKPRLI